MSRARQYESAAERQRAYRDRQRAASAKRNETVRVAGRGDDWWNCGLELAALREAVNGYDRAAAIRAAVRLLARLLGPQGVVVPRDWAQHYGLDN